MKHSSIRHRHRGTFVHRSPSVTSIPRPIGVGGTAFKLRGDAAIGRGGLIDLDESVGWTAYTRDPDRLVRALAGSRWDVRCWG